MPHPIVDEELRLLEDVLRALEDERPPDATAEESIARELERIRALLVSGEEQKDQLALLEQWDRGSALLRQLQTSRQAPRVERLSPYFAHLRLREAGRERDVCLGKATCIRRGVRIVDWRNAPVSRLYYRYQQGEAYEEEIADRTLVGEVVARRTVAIRAARLERVDAPEGSWVRQRDAWVGVEGQRPRLAGGEGIALRAHAEPATGRLGGDGAGVRRADKHLPEIAGLLDAEQFELISRPGPGCLVVRGSAGSGKTTVALHRIAYLAYADPHLDSPQALFLTLSPALRDYVGHVLPGLGLTRVGVDTFPEWAARLRLRLYPRLPDAVRAATPDYVRRVKLHPGIGRALADHVRATPGPTTPAQALDDWASVLTHAAGLERALGPDAASDAALAAAWCRARHEELFAWLEGDAEAPGELDVEDDALLLRAFQLRVGPLPAVGTSGCGALRYRHLAIDEVQDWAPVELRVVTECLGDPPSLTLAGDAQQRTTSHVAGLPWEALVAELGMPSAEIRTLRITYRSTREIMAFARSVLGPLWEDDAPPIATRSGPPVESFSFTDAGACVAFLADALRQLSRDEPLASVAVLAPTREGADLYFDGLRRSEVPRLRRVEGGHFSFAPGTEVCEIEQAKGLEFDYVVLVDASPGRFPDTPSSRRLLHVAASRAVHQLWVTSAGALSPLVI